MSGKSVTAPGPGSIRPFELPAIERTALPNGLEVYAVRQGDVPIVTVDVVVDAASVREPASRGGVAYLTMNALEAGGAGRTGADLAWAFERQGVELGIVTGWDDAHLVATASVHRLDATVALLRDVVCEPAFDDGEVERFRGEQLAEILQRRQEPRAMANDIIGRLLYGEDVAYGRHPVGRRSTLESLDRAETAAHHARWFTPRQVALVFAGDIDPTRVVRLAESHFGDWPNRGPRADLEWPAGTPAAPGIHVVDRPGSVQSEIRVGQVGVDRLHPDYFALRVMNTLFGGAFTSRLNLNLREKNGFTYGVRSGFAFRRRPGPFTIQTAVATDVTARAIEEILAETAKLRTDGVSDDETRNARDYLAGVMPLEMQTSRQMAARLTELFTYGLSADHLAGYRDGLAAVTPADVERVAREQIAPDRFVIAVVGDAAQIRGPLEALDAGPITVHEATE